jgi:hypothetical protein
MSVSSSDSEEMSMLEYIITHIFCPIELPQHDDYAATSDRALLDAVMGSARNFASRLPHDEEEQWSPLLKMLKNLGVTTTSISLTKVIESQIRSMKAGGMYILLEFKIDTHSKFTPQILSHI